MSSHVGIPNSLSSGRSLPYWTCLLLLDMSLVDLGATEFPLHLFSLKIRLKHELKYLNVSQGLYSDETNLYAVDRQIKLKQSLATDR